MLMFITSLRMLTSAAGRHELQLSDFGISRAEVIDGFKEYYAQYFPAVDLHALVNARL